MSSIQLFHEILIFLQLNCCGWDGPKEFAYNNEPIDESCYEKHSDDDEFANFTNRRSDDVGENALPTKKMKQVRMLLGERERPNAKTSYRTETVFSNNITRNGVVLSFPENIRTATCHLCME